MSVSRIAFLPSILFSTRVPAEPHAGDTLSIVPFLSLARDLAALLVPLEPAADFRASLEQSLVAEARQQTAQARLVPATLETRDGPERLWVVGAAAAAVGSAVSIAGLVVYVLRRRERAA